MGIWSLLAIELLAVSSIKGNKAHLKSFFNNLGDKAINDMFTLDVKLSQ
jgi:hypothetical protein